MTPEQIQSFATQAYRDLGYEVIRFRDGSLGVTRCPTKTINLMNRFQTLIVDLLESEAGSKHTCTTCPGCLAALADDGTTFSRLSKSFDGTEREWSPSERYQLFARGFRDGAAMHAIKHEGLGPYDLGYAEGRQSRTLATTSYAHRIGYEPTILRTADEKSPAHEEKKRCP